MRTPQKSSSLLWTGMVIVLLTVLDAILPAAFAADSAKKPVIIGFDAEAGHLTSTSDDAIRMGILIAIHEINETGGVLGGRPLELMVKDNRSVPARGIRNIEEFAEIPDLVAVVSGKFTPVVQEEIPLLHQKKMILLDAWAAGDNIIDNGQNPNYCFRLSLKDSWAVQTMLGYAEKRGFKRVGVLLPTTGWGRSNEKAINKYLATHQELSATTIQWFMWGDKSLLDKYETARTSGAEAILFVTNEAEGSVLVKEMASLPQDKRLPIICHWGITGGNFIQLTGEAISQVDLAVVQTYSFFDNRRQDKLKQFYQTAGQLFKITRPEDIPSPVGTAHAYDLTHILALAINKAGTTDRSAIHDALEQVQDYDGLIKTYPRPFTAERHEALQSEDLFMSRFRKDGAILRIQE